MGPTIKTTAVFFVVAFGAVVAAPSIAQNYPVKPVRIVTGSVGATNDILARHIAHHLTERWGKQVVVENRPGASGTIAVTQSFRAAPDGYTLIMAYTPNFATAPTLYKNLPYDPLKDFAPISNYAATPLMLLAHPSLPPSSLRDFIAFAKKRPGQVNFASAGSGTASRLTTELLILEAGLKLLHVPYKGSGAASVALMSGEAQFSSLVLPNALPMVKAGRVKAYAVTSRNRFAGAPDVPTAAEAGLPGFESIAWFGICAPARTPPDLVARLNRDIVEILKTPSVRNSLIGQGAEPVPTTPEEFGAYIRSEIEKWRKVIVAAGAKVD